MRFWILVSTAVRLAEPNPVGNIVTSGKRVFAAMKNRYALEILWSNQDDGYIAVCPEFSDLSAFGETREAALLEAQIALEQTIINYGEHGIPLPEPRSAVFEAIQPNTLSNTLSTFRR